MEDGITVYEESNDPKERAYGAMLRMREALGFDEDEFLGDGV